MHSLLSGQELRLISVNMLHSKYLWNLGRIWHLNITENAVFRRYKNNIIHSISFSINGLVMENVLVANGQDTIGIKKPDV